MIVKKKMIWMVSSVLFASFVIFVSIGIKDYLDFKSMANAIGECPTQDGGTITNYIPNCLMDTPPPPLTPLTCSACPLVSTAVVPGTCATYMEVDIKGQNGGTYISVPTDFTEYRGGGTYPKAGDQFLYCGVGYSVPWIIGIPGPVANRIQKLVNAYNNFIIAGKKLFE